MKLKDFQEQVFDYLSCETVDPAPYYFVKESKGIERKTRLDSYKRSFVFRTVETIENDFAVTGLFLGADDFTDYLKTYLKIYPSKTHYINEISRHLPEYIRQHRPASAAPFIVDLAQMEWLMIESFYNFYSMDADPKDKASPKETPPGETPLNVNPSLTLLESPWPLHKIWNKEKGYDKERSYLSLWALEDRIVRVAGWSNLEFQVLSALKKSGTLEQSIAKLEKVGATEEVAQIFTEKFPQWIEMGLLSIDPNYPK